MEMNPEVAQTALQWIQSRISENKCAVCGHTSMQVNKTLVCAPCYTTSDDGKNLVQANKVQPFVLLTCSNCAHARFFSAALMGLTGDLLGNG